MNINKLMFREYDIRGIYGEDINEEISYLIGRAFGSNLKKIGKETTIVGYDNRSSSPIVEENLVKGITESGVNVVRLGLVTTPMYYFAWDLLNIKCGIMITASHNPKEYNGFKFSYNGIHNAYGKDVYNLYDTIINKDFTEGNGTITFKNIKEEYLNLICENIELGTRKLKVVYDCGNGTTSIVAKDIFDRFDIETIPLFAESDPDFPNHHPDPCVEENLKDLKKAVKKNKADLGIAFDGDGDRVGVVDEKGNMIDIDKYLLIMWKYIYKKVDKKEAFFDIKCSNTLERELTKLGVKSNWTRTGNSYTRKISYEGDYPLGGEFSGHIYFRDKFPGYDDGMYNGIRLIERLSHTTKPLSKLLDGTEKSFTTKELKFKIEDTKKFKKIEEIKKYCIDKEYDILTIDGVKVNFKDGFALVRASNTGPNITARYEAKTQKRLKEITEEFNNLIEN